MKKACSVALAVLFLIIFTTKVAGQAVINEFVVDGSPEWVELYNASSSAEYLKEYYIDDDESFTSDSGSSGKKSLANLNISNITYPFFELSSSIFNNGDPDYVVLFDKSGNLIDSYSYSANPGNNISIGRSPDNSGDFYILQSLTKGLANALPTPSPSPSPTLSPVPTSAPTSTPNPTKTPTATPTKTPSPAPTKTPSPSPTLEPTVLVESTNAPSSFPSPSPIVEGISVKKSSLIPFLLIGLGMICLGFAGYSVFKNYKSTYNGESEDQESEEE